MLRRIRSRFAAGWIRKTTNSAEFAPEYQLDSALPWPRRRSFWVRDYLTLNERMKQEMLFTQPVRYRMTQHERLILRSAAALNHNPPVEVLMAR